MRDVGLVPQEPADLFFAESVDAECAADGGTSDARALLDRLAPGIDGAMHPRDLSEGQRLALALALVVAAEAAGALARRADAWPRLSRQSPPGHRVARPRRYRNGRDPRDARRRTRRRGEPSHRCLGGRRSGGRRPDRVGRHGIADVRTASREDPRATAVADRRTGARHPRSRTRHDHRRIAGERVARRSDASPSSSGCGGACAPDRRSRSPS